MFLGCRDVKYVHNTQAGGLGDRTGLRIMLNFIEFIFKYTSTVTTSVLRDVGSVSHASVSLDYKPCKAVISTF